MESQKINIYNLVKAVKEIGYSHIPSPLKDDFKEFVKITMWGRDFAYVDEDKNVLDEVREIVERFDEQISHLKELKGWPEDQLYQPNGEITKENFSKHEKYIDFDLLPSKVTEWYYQYKYHYNFESKNNATSAFSPNDSYSPINSSTFITVVNGLNRWSKMFGGLPKRKFKSSGLDGGKNKLSVTHSKLTIFNTFDFYAINNVIDLPFDLNVLHLMVRENTNYGADFSLLINNPIARHAIDMMLNFLTDAADGLEKTAEIKGVDLLTGSYNLSVEDVFEYAHRIDTTLMGGELGKQIIQLAYILEHTPIGDNDNYPKDFEDAIKSIGKILGEFIFYLGGVPLKQTKTSLEGATKQKTEKGIIPFSESADILHEAYLILKNNEASARRFLNLLIRLQHAIVNNKIRKSDEYADCIQDLQRALISSIKGKNLELKLNSETQKQMELIGANFEANRLFEFVVNKNNEPVSSKYVKSDLENYLRQANLALKSPIIKSNKVLSNRFKAIKSTIEQALRTGTIFIAPDFELGNLKSKKKEPTGELNEFASDRKNIDTTEELLFGIEPAAQVQLPAVMSAEQMAALQIDRLPFTGLLKQVLGQPEHGFAFMLYGSPGSGKTIFSLWMSMQLALSFGNVLYVTAEQYPKGSLTTRIQEMKAAGTLGLDFTKRIDNPEVNINLYDFIIIDSVNSHNLSVEQFRELQKQYPQKSFILILQTLKNGNYRGSREWEHDTDIVAKIENREIEISKSRYDTTGSVKIPDLLAKPENQQED